MWQEKVPRVAGKGKDLILRKHKHEGKKVKGLGVGGSRVAGLNGNSACNARPAADAFKIESTDPKF